MKIPEPVLVFGGAALVLTVVSVVALEAGEVAILRTHAADGTPRETRVWVADHDGVPWIEAASPGRPWYAEIRQDPKVELQRDGAWRRYFAMPQPGPTDHERIRSLLREKYGLADLWVGLLQDTSGSIAVRLEPLENAPRIE